MAFISLKHTVNFHYSIVLDFLSLKKKSIDRKSLWSGTLG